MKQVGVRLLARLYAWLAPFVGRLERFHSGRSLLPLAPAYEFVQDDVAQRLHEYLRTNREQLQRIVIVGAWQGTEVDDLLLAYPNCQFLLLEPSRDVFPVLYARLGSHPRVTCMQVAASDEAGTGTFRETNIDGNGSLLPLADPGESVFLPTDIKETDTYEVPTVALDNLPELDGQRIDCLWIDVQGFETSVLAGAEKTLGRTSAAFIEVMIEKHSYKDASSFEEIAATMTRHGFRFASLGTDPANGGGNAFWIRTS